MQNMIGNKISLTLTGASHAPYVGFQLSGFPKGIGVDEDFIKACLSTRRPISFETPRLEEDHYEIISGIKDGKTTGEMIEVHILNQNYDDKPYNDRGSLLRASHADYPAYVKYGADFDLRGGGIFSGRMSASWVFVGGIIIPLLEKQGIKIVSHILQAYDIKDEHLLSLDDEKKIKAHKYPTILDLDEKMDELFREFKMEKSSFGGIIETSVFNLPVGLGEALMDSCEAKLTYNLFSIGGIKGVEFGDGFNFTNLKGEDALDKFLIEDGKVAFKSNHNGGINGGLTNGAPLNFKVAVKPIASIKANDELLDYDNLKIVKKELDGRFDTSIVRRIIPAIDSVCAFTILDLILEAGIKIW